MLTYFQNSIILWSQTLFGWCEEIDRFLMKITFERKLRFRVV